MFRKNVASQHVAAQMNSRTDGSPLTSSVSVNVTIDAGTQGAGAGTLTHQGNGQWDYVPTQAETNGTHVAFQFTHASGIDAVVNVWPVSFDPTNATNLGLTDIDATISSRMATFTLPTNFSSLSVDASGRMDVGKWLGTAPNALISGRVDANPGALQSGVITAASIAASALNGKGDWNTTTPPTTAAIATAIWQDTTASDFTTASSIGKSLYTSGNAPGAASGIALVGSNMGTVSSVTGSVASVTGAVGSVTAAVSVTGDLSSTMKASVETAVWDAARASHTTAGSFGQGAASVQGNVTGSTASVTGAVGSVTAGVTLGAASVDSVALATSGINAIWAATTRNLTGSQGVKKNTAKSAFMFAMTDSTNHNPATGLTLTAQRSLDGGAFAGCANAVVEIGSGWYKIDLAASDLNADTVALKFTATGADQLNISLVTSS